MPRLGQADGALEKLPVAVDERDERDRRFQEARRETRQAVEWLFSRRVEEPRPAERCEPVQIADDIDEIRHASTLPRTAWATDYSPRVVISDFRLLIEKLSCPNLQSAICNC